MSFGHGTWRSMMADPVSELRRGDVVWVELDPVLGRERSGRPPTEANVCYD